MLGQVTVNIIVSLEPIVWHLDQNLHRRHNYHANTCQVVDPYSFSFLLGIGRLRINRSNLLHSHSDPGNHHLCVIWLLHLFGLKRMLVNGRGCWPPPGLMWASGARLKPAVFMSNGSWSESSLSARAHIWGVSLAFTIGVHAYLRTSQSSLALHLLYISDSRCFKEMLVTYEGEHGHQS